MSYLYNDGGITTLNQQDDSSLDDGGPMADDDVDADLEDEDVSETGTGETEEDME